MAEKNRTADRQTAAEAPPLRVGYLKCLSGDIAGKVFSVSGTIIIGRRSDCHIVIPAKGVSRQHAVIEVHGTDYLLKDLDSANGTFVNGKRIHSVLLAPGDEITVDTIRFLFKVVSSAGPGEEAEPASAGQRKAEPASETAVLKLEKSPAQTALTAGFIVVLAVLVFLLIWSMFI